VNFEEAIALYTAKIDEAERVRAQREAEQEAAAKAARQTWTATLRERIELQHGVRLTDEQVAAWEVKQVHEKHYEMCWVLGDGYVRTILLLTENDLMSGQKIEWGACHYASGYIPGFASLIAAAAYATTGKQLA